MFAYCVLRVRNASYVDFQRYTGSCSVWPQLDFQLLFDYKLNVLKLQSLFKVLTWLTVGSFGRSSVRIWVENALKLVHCSFQLNGRILKLARRDVHWNGFVMQFETPPNLFKGQQACPYRCSNFRLMLVCTAVSGRTKYGHIEMIRLFLCSNWVNILTKNRHLSRCIQFYSELCADELVVGGGVGWSYDRLRRRAAYFSSAAAAWLYGRRRRRQTEWDNSETAHSLDRRFFLVLHGSATSPVISAGLLWRRKVNCEYARCAKFHSRNELIVHCLISGGSYKCNVECWGNADGEGVENAALENVGIKIWQAFNRSLN